MCVASISGNYRRQVDCKVPNRICGAGSLVTWVCKIHTETALSTSEAEFILSRKGLRSLIPLMPLLEKMQKMGVEMVNRQDEIRCKVFEDYSGA